MRFGTLAFLLALAFQATTSLGVVQDREPWMRLANDPQQIKMNKTGTYLAYVESTRPGLFMVNVKDQNVYKVSDKKVGAAFFWSPDGHRLFYREMNQRIGKVNSEVKVYDTGLHKNVSINKMEGPSSFLTYDPRHQGMRILHATGIKHNQLKYPGKRAPAKDKADVNSWLATPVGILQLSADGKAMHRIEDDKSGVSSFDISSDGKYIAWATTNGTIYVADTDAKVGTKIDRGFDPAWHPTKHVLIYAGARLLGNVAAGFDIKISDLAENQTFLTDSKFSNERWPIWQPDGKTIIYTKQRTTDLYKMALNL